MSFRDCFAHQEMCCSILTEKVCNKGKCSFYKTHKKFLEDSKRYPPINYKHFLETGEKIVLEPKRTKEYML